VERQPAEVRDLSLEIFLRIRYVFLRIVFLWWFLGLRLCRGLMSVMVSLVILAGRMFYGPASTFTVENFDGE